MYGLRRGPYSDLKARSGGTLVGLVRRLLVSELEASIGPMAVPRCHGRTLNPIYPMDPRRHGHVWSSEI